MALQRPYDMQTWDVSTTLLRATRNVEEQMHFRRLMEFCDEQINVVEMNNEMCWIEKDSARMARLFCKVEQATRNDTTTIKN